MVPLSDAALAVLAKAQALKLAGTDHRLPLNLCRLHNDVPGRRCCRSCRRWHRTPPFQPTFRVSHFILLPSCNDDDPRAHLRRPIVLMCQGWAASATAMRCSPTELVTPMHHGIEMAARGAWANIKPLPGRKRRPGFGAFLYRYRNLVERLFNKPKNFRAVANQYNKRDDTFLAALQLAAIRIWLRHKRHNQPLA